MRLEAIPISNCSSESASPAAAELISQLRTSFFPLEFEYVSKTLTDREERMKEQYSELQSKAEEEKELLYSENLKLNDELRKKQNEIDAIMKLNSEYAREFRVYEKRFFEYYELKMKAEEEKSELVIENQKKQNEIDVIMKVNAEYESKIRVYEKRFLEYLELKAKFEEEKDLLFSENLKLNDELKKKQNEIDPVMKLNAEDERKIRVYRKGSLESEAKEQKDCAFERYKPPLFSEKDIKKKTESKLHEIIQIDDDDDLEFISTTKRKHDGEAIKSDTSASGLGSVAEKIELKYSSRLYKICRNKSYTFFPNSRSQEKRSDIINET